jgi:hypothetical protein
MVPSAKVRTWNRMEMGVLAVMLGPPGVRDIGRISAEGSRGAAIRAARSLEIGPADRILTAEWEILGGNGEER